MTGALLEVAGEYVTKAVAMSNERFALARSLAQLAADIEGLSEYCNRTHPDISACVVRKHDLAPSCAGDRAGKIYDETDE
jgi:hypothetical protein